MVLPPPPPVEGCKMAPQQTPQIVYQYVQQPPVYVNTTEPQNVVPQQVVYQPQQVVPQQQVIYQPQQVVYQPQYVQYVETEPISVVVPTRTITEQKTIQACADVVSLRVYVLYFF